MVIILFFKLITEYDDTGFYSFEMGGQMTEAELHDELSLS